MKSARCTGFSHSNTDRVSDYSKPSKSAKNSPGLRAPSVCRQFHWKTCCFTAGWNWLDPSTLILAHTFGGSQVLRHCQVLSKTCKTISSLRDHVKKRESRYIGQTSKNGPRLESPRSQCESQRNEEPRSDPKPDERLHTRTSEPKLTAT